MDDDPDIRWRRVISAPVATEPLSPESSRADVELAATSICGRLRADNTDHYMAIRLGRLQETLLTSLSASDLPARFEEFAYAMVVIHHKDNWAVGVHDATLGLEERKRRWYLHLHRVRPTAGRDAHR